MMITLREAQKERFKKLARMLRPHHHYMHARFEERRDGRDRYGYGRDGEGRGQLGAHDNRQFGGDDSR